MVLIIGPASSDLERRHNGVAAEGAKLGFHDKILFKSKLQGLLL
jgi:hypothetical protein